MHGGQRVPNGLQMPTYPPNSYRIPLEATPTTANARKLDCEAAAADCRFIIQSENEDEAVELARKHARDVHGREFTDEELRGEHLQVV